MPGWIRIVIALLVGFGVGIAAGYSLGLSSSAPGPQDDHASSGADQDAAARPGLRGGAAAGDAPAPSKEAAAPSATKAGEGAPVELADLAAAVRLAQRSEAHTPAEIEALIAKLALAQAGKRKHAFRSIVLALARSDDPAAEALLLRLMDGEAGEHPHEAIDWIMASWLRADRPGLSARVRAALPLDGGHPPRPLMNADLWVRYLMRHGTAADQHKLLESPQEYLAKPAWAERMRMAPERAPALFDEAMADGRLHWRSGSLAYAMGRTHSEAARTRLEAWLSAAGRGEALPYKLKLEDVVHAYAVSLAANEPSPPALDRGAAFIHASPSPLIQILFVEQMVAWLRSWSYDARPLAILRHVPARVIERGLAEPPVTGDAKAAFDRARGNAMYQGFLLNEENAAALEKAAEAATGSEREQARNFAAFVRRELARGGRWR